MNEAPSPRSLFYPTPARETRDGRKGIGSAGTEEGCHSEGGGYDNFTHCILQINEGTGT